MTSRCLYLTASLTKPKNWERQKQEAYDDMDNDGFGYWTVFTAGAGLFTGAYDVSPPSTHLHSQ